MLPILSHTAEKAVMLCMYVVQFLPQERKYEYLPLTVASSFQLFKQGNQLRNLINKIFHFWKQFI
jgi:hypothetical protein